MPNFRLKFVLRYTQVMNNQRARYVWDYELTQEQLDAVLNGRYTDGKSLSTAFMSG